MSLALGPFSPAGDVRCVTPGGVVLRLGRLGEGEPAEDVVVAVLAAALGLVVDAGEEPVADAKCDRGGAGARYSPFLSRGRSGCSSVGVQLRRVSGRSLRPTGLEAQNSYPFGTRRCENRDYQRIRECGGWDSNPHVPKDSAF